MYIYKKKEKCYLINIRLNMPLKRLLKTLKHIIFIFTVPSKKEIISVPLLMSPCLQTSEH